MTKDYSQTGEQEFIESFFKDFKGTYLDIGAFDGVEMSNTLRLLELGWNGIALEASPITFTRLKQNYQTRDHQNCQLINKAMVPNYWKKDMIFYESFYTFNDGQRTVGLGTFAASHLEKYPWIENVQELKVETIKTKEFFKTYGTDFNFISIDVEELNFELVLDINWQEFNNLKLLCVECDIQDYRFLNFFEHFDLKLIEQKGPNLFFTKS